MTGTKSGVQRNMQIDSFLELIKAGNTNAVAQQWSGLLEGPEAVPALYIGYDRVLEELVKLGKTALAEELAWTAIETAMGRYSATDVLTMASPFLLAVGESETLRKEVGDLYRSAYADCDGIDALLAEAGIAGGRPVRRALRSLEVCLSLDPGSYLVAREGDAAARVESIERPAWRFTITSADGEETLGAVPLADRYRPASPDEFPVQRCFAGEVLTRRLWDDPSSVLMEICRKREKGIEDEELQALLVPHLLSAADWKKWWTQARNAVKRCPNIQVEGRSPCKLQYVHSPSDTHEALSTEIERLREPLEKLAAIEKYLRECKNRGEGLDRVTLQGCLDRLVGKAEQLTAAHGASAAIWWLVARRTAELADIKQPWGRAVESLRSVNDVGGLLRLLEDENLLQGASEWFSAADPKHWTVKWLQALPALPHGVCDLVASRLVKAGVGRSDFEPAVQAILAAPINCFESLLWLWDGPTLVDAVPVPTLPILLSRILRTLDDCRRDDKLPKDVAREMGLSARSVLSARQYARFRECLEQLDATVAQTYSRILRQLDNLGKAVPEDLVSLIRRKFPPVLDAAKEAYPWENESVIYVTAAGLSKKQDEVHHHVNVTMKENSVAIGRAAEHGDLSENSEYKFALEERDLLRARLAQMNSEVAAARVIPPSDVPTDYAGIGTRVSFERIADSQRYVLTLVGPWEADPPAGLLNYKTPLAGKILGKRIGEAIEFEHSGATGVYRVVSLENSLDSHSQARPVAPLV